MRRPALRSFAWPILLAVLAAAGCTGWESMYRANPAAPWALPIPDARLLTIVDNDDTLRTADTLVANGQMLLGASACAEIDLPRAKLKALRVGALTLAVQTLPFTTAGGARSNVYVVTYWVPAGAITPNRAAERELVAEVWASRPNVRYLDAKHLVRRMDEAAAASRALVLDESQIERAQLFTAPNGENRLVLHLSRREARRLREMLDVRPEAYLKLPTSGASRFTGQLDRRRLTLTYTDRETAPRVFAALRERGTPAESIAATE